MPWTADFDERVDTILWLHELDRDLVYAFGILVLVMGYQLVRLWWENRP